MKQVCQHESTGVNFRYRAIDPNGRKLEADLQAMDRREALEQLARQGLRVTRLHEADSRQATARSGRVSRDALLLTLTELATLLRSGVNLKDALDSLSGGDREASLQALIENWATQLRQGNSLSQALTESSVDLPDYVIQLVQAGELTGEMGRSLQTAVDQLSYEKKIRDEMQNALIYPAVLVFSGIAAVLLVFTFVVPKFENLLDRSADLPLLAWSVLVTGKWVNAHLWWVLGCGAAAAIVLVRVAAMPGVRLRVADALQRIPVVGEWIVEAETARWASIMAALTRHRVPILKALELAESSVQLPSRRRRLNRAASQVKSGVPLSTALKDNAVITETGFNLLRAGEKSGEVAQLLSALAELHDTSGRNRMTRFLTLIEPAAILLIGGVIGIIIMGVILAITSANDIVI